MQIVEAEDGLQDQVGRARAEDLRVDFLAAAEVLEEVEVAVRGS